MKLRTQQNLRMSEMNAAEQVLSRIQWLRANAEHIIVGNFSTDVKNLQEIFEKLEKEFIELCYDLEFVTRGDKSILMRALKMYSAKYQEMKGNEKHPAHKQDLQNYIDAADRLYEKLFGVPKPTEKV